MVNKNVHSKYPRPYIAVASIDGLFINLDLKESEKLRVYKPKEKDPELVDIRNLPNKNVKGTARWKELAETLKDCSHLLVHGIDRCSLGILSNSGIQVYVVEGFIDKAIVNLHTGKDISYMFYKEEAERPASCCGEHTGCDDDPLY